jgi:carbonic anhydrase/acetyltransferase-like protein (isoleucine patch superfamily)
MVIAFEGKAPLLDPSVFVAPGAQVIGDVAIGADSSIWYNCVVRGDVNFIRIGARTNLQDGTIVHVDAPQPGREHGTPTLIGDDVLIGHMAIIHACVLHDRAFVGMGATVMDDCVIEGDAMLAAGALLTPGKVISSGQLWAGRPAKYVRDLTADEKEAHRLAVDRYVKLARRHKRALEGQDPQG